ncbi:MAG: cysteine--1-D-myo-inosityl 2-amino-2-deoxy-alpha-D-glucopyranoside ligase [Micrococcales bacterium]|nr:MAG: cysteine--1-D-myo-inosityl 2-amino-2-deoxy-alpha-D-glucopyranoside ligase [Micrococcales bacterium]
MRAWPAPSMARLARLASPGIVPQLMDTASNELRPSATGDSGSLYVCGITPYDATHMGHAATYVAFDLLHRAWRDAGLRTRYVQNVTDVDDPLLERAHEIGVDWQALAERETHLFRDDMTALRVLPPDSYLGATETVPWVVEAVQDLVAKGAAYRVPVTDGTLMYDSAGDVYFDVTSDDDFGWVSGWDRQRMLAVFGQRGGDPDRPGKRHRLDPLLWRVARNTEPAWDGDTLGPGRPGWHLECVAIAMRSLQIPFDVHGGGSDLVFPHHEMGASHAHVLTGRTPYAHAYVHAGMVGLDGQKMSKSKGNLVLVSTLREQGVDPMVIRLAILAHHYRSDWDWTDEALMRAGERLAAWRSAVAAGWGADPNAASPQAWGTVGGIRAALARDLDAPDALAVVDEWVHDAGAATDSDRALVRDAVDMLLGVALAVR